MLITHAMANNTKLFRTDFSRGFMQAVRDGIDEMTLDELREINEPLPPLSRWRPYKAHWRHRSGRPMKIPTVSQVSGNLCIRADTLQRLVLDLSASVELLPFAVEGEAWFLMRALHCLSNIDPATSEPLFSFRLSDSDPYGWINAADPRAEQAMIFHTRPGGRDTWVTDEFVRRVKAAGLVGLRFIHSGYLVRDLTHAQPRPRPKPGSVGSIAPRPPALVSELDVERHALRDQARVHASRLLPAAAAASADECIDRLDGWLEEGRRRWKRLGSVARAEHIAATAAAFGDLVCRELGWHWVTLHVGDDEPCLAIAHANKTCALRVERFVERQFTASERTLKLQFNMLRAGQLPAPPATGVAVIG